MHIGGLLVKQIRKKNHLVIELSVSIPELEMNRVFKNFTVDLLYGQ